MVSPTCPYPGIPAHLHSNGRSSLGLVPAEDYLYMWHPALPSGAEYGPLIPGKRYDEDQSVNSHLLNPKGAATDVLYNPTGGPHRFDFDIACFPASEVIALKIPNENPSKPKTSRLYSRDRVEQEQVVYDFEVVHEPEPCMYPHCVMYLRRDGKRIQTLNSSSMKTRIRKAFARIAEAHRVRMREVVEHFRASTGFGSLNPESGPPAA